MYQQIKDFMNDKSLNLLTNFRKNRSTQHCLMRIFEKRKKALDKGGYICAKCLDFSKVLTQ